MGKKNPDFDKHIAKANDFAKPILAKIREIIHAACPDVEEELKWSNPSFMYRGILCGMAAFKAHCTFGFWKHELVLKMVSNDAAAALERAGRMESLADVPSKKLLTECVKAAMTLNDEGVKVERPKKPKAELVVPDYFLAALKTNKKAQATFEAFSPSHKREYVEWIVDAKQEATRERRIQQALEWLAEGKSRNWKYQNC